MIDFNRLNALGNTAIGTSFIRGKESLREDVLFYDKLAVEILMVEITELSANESKILCDVINLAFLESNFMQSWITQMHKEGRGWYFGIDNYNDFFKQFGWKIKLTQPGEENANYGRWRYKVFPVSLSHIPRYFFIEAIKSTNPDLD